LIAADLNVVVALEFDHERLRGSGWGLRHRYGLGLLHDDHWRLGSDGVSGIQIIGVEGIKQAHGISGAGWEMAEVLAVKA